MSWRRDGRRWEERRSPVWEPRRSASPDRDRDRDRTRDRHHRFERKERPERTDRWGGRSERQDLRDELMRELMDDRDMRGDHSRSRDRSRDRDRDRDRSRDRRRSPRRQHEDHEIPSAPSPPRISRVQKSPSKSRSKSIEMEIHDYEDTTRRETRREEDTTRRDTRRDDDYEEAQEQEGNPQVINASPGDWYCKCGSYNFKRRQVCYRRNCFGKRSEGVVYGGDKNPEGSGTNAGITKRLLFRRLDALTTEEKILDALKEVCSKPVLDSIAGITIGRETLTGASKCLAYINFNSIADSTAAFTELMALKEPLIIDNREVLMSYYNEPVKHSKPVSNIDYAAYYAQAAAYSTNTQAMSEADRVNAAAAVAQSAISAAHARQWTPVAAPTFISNTAAQSTTAKSLPTGDGKTKYSAPDVRTFMYDETSGYYYDPGSGLYYDGKTQYFFNNQTNQYMYWDTASSTYISATQQQQNTDQPKLPSPPEATIQNTIVKEPEEKKKKEKEDKVKVAKKIAKDMERWARTLNQKKENAKSNVVQEQILDMSASKGSVDIGFSVLSAGPSIAPPVQQLVREPSPPPEDFLMKKANEQIYDTDDDGIIDWSKLTCLLCKRRFPSHDVLNKHKSLSDLHKQNLAEYRKKNDLLPQVNGYRDRAAERRMKFGEDEAPVVRKRYEPPESRAPPPPKHPPPSVVDTIGGKMLQKMGWSQGRGLGKEEQGRIAPIEAEQRPSLAGLGQKRGIYTPTPGETYRDTVKKLMIARYKEVVGQEDD